MITGLKLQYGRCLASLWRGKLLQKKKIKKESTRWFLKKERERERKGGGDRGGLTSLILKFSLYGQLSLIRSPFGRKTSWDYKIKEWGILYLKSLSHPFSVGFKCFLTSDDPLRSLPCLILGIVSRRQRVSLYNFSDATEFVPGMFSAVCTLEDGRNGFQSEWRRWEVFVLSFSHCWGFVWPQCEVQTRSIWGRLQSSWLPLHTSTSGGKWWY